MLKHYIRTAWRNLLKDRVYTIVSSIGLAVGLSVFIVVLLFVNYENSYDG